MNKTRNSGRLGRSPNFVDPITVGFDRLQILIQGYAKQFVDRHFWLTPMAAGLTLLLTLIVSDFRDTFGVRGDVWRVLAIIALAMFTVWMFIAILRALKAESLEATMDGIASESQSPLRNYALAFFRAKDRNGTNHILVYFDDIWNCFFVPYVNLQPDQSDPADVEEPMADRFGLPKHALKAVELDSIEVRETKLSKASQKVNHYRFTFYPIKVQRSYAGTFVKSEFEIQARRYKWMTIEELLAHPTSMERNGEVYRFFRDNRHAFFGRDHPLAIEAHVGD